jgi:hypothetical protein
MVFVWCWSSVLSSSEFFLYFSDAIPAICDFGDGRSPAREFENLGRLPRG